MSDEQKPPGAISPGKSQAKDDRQAKLAEALRANLRRRKAPSARAEPPRGQGEADGGG